MELTFGKYNGQSLEDVLGEDPQYIVWLRNNTFVKIPKDILAKAEETIAYDNAHQESFEDMFPDWGNKD